MIFLGIVEKPADICCLFPVAEAEQVAASCPWWAVLAEVLMSRGKYPQRTKGFQSCGDFVFQHGTQLAGSM
jgi:hypothetical protein